MSSEMAPTVAEALVHLDDTLVEITALVAKGRDVIEADHYLPMVMQWLGIRLGHDIESVPEEWRAERPEVPWHAIRGLRNRLAHDYHVVNISIVWTAFSVGVPAMREMLSSDIAAARRALGQPATPKAEDST